MSVLNNSLQNFQGCCLLFNYQGSYLLSHRQLYQIITSSSVCQQLFLILFCCSFEPLFSRVSLDIIPFTQLHVNSFSDFFTLFYIFFSNTTQSINLILLYYIQVFIFPYHNCTLYILTSYFIYLFTLYFCNTFFYIRLFIIIHIILYFLQLSFYLPLQLMMLSLLNNKTGKPDIDNSKF